MKIKYKKSAILTFDNGKEVHCQWLGKGMFCQAWQNKNDVYLIVDSVNDPSKEILCSIYKEEGKVKHLPGCQRIDTYGDKYVYLMPYYRNITAKDKEAWKQYRELKNFRESISSFAHKCQHDVNLEVLKFIPKSPIRNALELLLNWSTNYGDQIGWEFSPRNLGVDSRGNLILRDVMFDCEKIEKIWKEREKRRRRF